MSLAQIFSHMSYWRMVIPLFYKFIFEGIASLENNNKEINVNINGGQILNLLYIEINNRV